jgi:hypothetical protein
MDNKFLLIYSFENSQGLTSDGYNWYKTEDEMKDDIEFKKNELRMKDFKIIESMEILQARDIQI